MFSQIEKMSSVSAQVNLVCDNGQENGVEVWILVGAPGSGKSTFARQLTDLGWVRICPEQGNMRMAEKQMIQAIKQGILQISYFCNFVKGKVL